MPRRARLGRDAGLTVSSLGRGEFFGADDYLEDNRRAIDELAGALELAAPFPTAAVGSRRTLTTSGGTSGSGS